MSSYFSIICLCEKRSTNCTALKQMLLNYDDKCAVHITPAIVPALDYKMQAAPGFTVGELGCYLSHMAALQAFLDSDCEIGGTLEDDLHYQDEDQAKELLQTVQREILYHGADIVNLDTDWQGRASAAIERGFLYTRFPGVQTSFIMYSRAGAFAWLAALEKNASTGYMYPCDFLFRKTHLAIAVPVNTPFYQKREDTGVYASTIAEQRPIAYQHRRSLPVPDFVVYYSFRALIKLSRNRKKCIISALLIVIFIVMNKQAGNPKK